jgi:hypothetical protein
MTQYIDDAVSCSFKKTLTRDCLSLMECRLCCFRGDLDLFYYHPVLLAFPNKACLMKDPGSLEGLILPATLTTAFNIPSSWNIPKLLKYCSIRICRFLLSNGPIAQHVAFILDGNRRFGKKMYNSTKMGHSLGLERLLQVSF